LADEFYEINNKAVQATPSRNESEQPAIITDFSIPTLRLSSGAARKNCQQRQKTVNFLCPGSKEIFFSSVNI
jgi:hypothetical protein